MINIMSDILFDKMVSCYNRIYPNGFLDKSKDVNNDIREALIDRCLIVYTQNFSGFVVMFPYDNKIALNPWFLGGYPIGEGAESLLNEAIKYYEESDYESIEIIGDKEYLQSKEIPLPYCYDYVDMVKEIDVKYKIEESFKHISEFDETLLKDLYSKSFSSSDACFYKLQSEEEKKVFWKYLSYDKALLDPCSLAIMRDDELAGYIFSTRTETSRHISCMVVMPSYQHQGLGSILLKGLCNLSKDLGDLYVTLGTEKTMKAFLLYKKFDFKEKNTRSYYIRKG